MNLKNAGNVLAGWASRAGSLEDFASQVEAWQESHHLHPTFSMGETPDGMQYALKFPTGQVLSVIVSRSGQIERSYTDHGDVHMDKVLPLIRGWAKVIDQAQRGGRRRGMKKETQEKYDRIGQAWYLAKGKTEEEFCRKAEITRRTLDRILEYLSDKNVTQKRA